MIVHVCGIIVPWFFVVLYAHVSMVFIKGSGKSSFLLMLLRQGLRG